MVHNGRQEPIQKWSCPGHRQIHTPQTNITSDVEYTIEQLTEEITNTANASIPKTTPPKDKKVLWWNKQVAECIRKRKIALHKYKRYTLNDQTKLKLLRQLYKAKKKARKAIRQAKADSWEQFLNSINSEQTETRDLWNKINALSGKQKRQKITIFDGTSKTNTNKQNIGFFRTHHVTMSKTTRCVNFSLHNHTPKKNNLPPMCHKTDQTKSSNAWHHPPPPGGLVRVKGGKTYSKVWAVRHSTAAS